MDSCGFRKAIDVTGLGLGFVDVALPALVIAARRGGIAEESL